MSMGVTQQRRCPLARPLASSASAGNPRLRGRIRTLAPMTPSVPLSIRLSPSAPAPVVLPRSLNPQLSTLSVPSAPSGGAS